MYATQFIKSFYKIKDLLTEQQIEDLGNYAYQYAKFFRVYFKIISIDKNKKTIIIGAEQQKKPTKTPYFCEKELNDKCKELFTPLFEGYSIHIAPTTYKEAPASIVTPEWIQQQMIKHKIGAKYLSHDIGIPQSELSALLNKHRQMGIRTKGLFYYYFKSL